MMPFRQHRRQRVYAFAFMDALCIAATYIFAAYWTALSPEVAPYCLFNYLPYLVVFCAVWFAAAIDERLWSSRADEGMAAYLGSVTKAVGDAIVFCVFLMVIFAPEGFARRFLLTFGVATLCILLLVRAGARILMWEYRRWRHNESRILIVGANDRTIHLADVLRHHFGHACIIGGLLEDDPERVALLGDTTLRHLGPVNRLPELFATRDIQAVYVCLPVRSHYEAVQDVAHFCEGAGVPVFFMADLFPVHIATSRLLHVEDIPLLSLSTISEARVMLTIKRIMDIALSTLLLIALSPFFALLAILIKLDSPGPLLFGQERVGQNQRRFRMLKFRSMVANAEALRKQLEAQNEASGPVFKIRRDPRVTRVGRWIRRFSVDEFPQLWNVLIGEMSLVGPRPPLPSEVEKYSWSQRRRLSVKPGMTGLWQVSGRSDIGFEEWVALDLTYIDTWTIWLDFVILFRTFKAVVTHKGAA